VGLIRTALFNWAYARHTGGTLVLRIEDTDAARDSEESYQQLLEALRWLGIDWDEGVELGGPHAPYRQSQRGEIYAEVIGKLLAGGYVYESFSTPAEVEARHRAGGRDPKLGYDNADRQTTDEQKAAFRAEGRTPVLRLRMPDSEVAFDDLIRGRVTFPLGSVPDFVVVRAADLDPLVPVQPQPAQRVEQLQVALLAVPGGIGVLDPEHEGAAVVAGVRPVEQRGADQADVRGAGRRRAEPHPDRRVGRLTHDAGQRIGRTLAIRRRPR